MLPIATNYLSLSELLRLSHSRFSLVRCRYNLESWSAKLLSKLSTRNKRTVVYNSHVSLWWWINILSDTFNYRKIWYHRIDKLLSKYQTDGAWVLVVNHDFWLLLKLFANAKHFRASAPNGNQTCNFLSSLRPSNYLHATWTNMHGVNVNGFPNSYLW